MGRIHTVYETSTIDKQQQQQQQQQQQIVKNKKRKKLSKAKYI